MSPDFRTEDHRTNAFANKLERRITTIHGECPSCASHSLIKYVDYEGIIGCLDCGWKEIESIDYSIQKTIANLERTLERIKRQCIDLEYAIKVIGQYRGYVDRS